jgi:hypothetical protein
VNDWPLCGQANQQLKLTAAPARIRSAGFPSGPALCSSIPGASSLFGAPPQLNCSYVSQTGVRCAAAACCSRIHSTSRKEASSCYRASQRLTLAAAPNRTWKCAVQMVESVGAVLPHIPRDVWSSPAAERLVRQAPGIGNHELSLWPKARPNPPTLASSTTSPQEPTRSNALTAGS